MIIGLSNTIYTIKCTLDLCVWQGDFGKPLGSLDIVTSNNSHMMVLGSSRHDS